MTTIYPTSSLQNFGFAIIVVFPVIAFITTCLRVYSRATTVKLGSDDILVLIAMVMSVGETFTMWNYMRFNFVGIHVVDIPLEYDLVLGLKYNFAVQVLYNPILSIIKASLLIFLARLAGQKKAVKVTIWVLFAFNAALMVAIFIMVIFQCTPISFNWDLNQEGYCINQGMFYVATSALTIFTDVLVLMIPFWIVMGLKMPRKTKFAVVGIFFLGFIVTIVGIARLILLVQGFFGTPVADYTYSLGFTTSAMETNLAIITANAPAMKPLLKNWFPRLFSSRSRGDPYSGPYGGSSYARKSMKLQSGPGLRSGHGGFALKDMKGRAEIRSTTGKGSEEEIMTYNGIVKTTDVSVRYMDERDLEDSEGSRKQRDMGMRTSIDNSV